MSVLHGQQELTIYSGYIMNDTHQACEKVRMILAGIESAVGLNSDQYFDVRVILSELLQNALRHGCVLSQQKVYMNVRLSGRDMLSITVQDDGNGFNASKVMEDSQNLQRCKTELAENGRGLQIVKSLCDDMVFNQKGNCITVRKKLS